MTLKLWINWKLLTLRKYYCKSYALSLVRYRRISNLTYHQLTGGSHKEFLNHQKGTLNILNVCCGGRGYIKLKETLKGMINILKGMPNPKTVYHLG